MVASVVACGTPPDHPAEFVQLPPAELVHCVPPDGGISLTAVPPRPSLATANRVPEATPNRFRTSLIPPFVTVSVPLVGSKVAVVVEPNVRARKSIVSPFTKPLIGFVGI